ncbi:hypothetical protein N7451_005664 [Penicillium sp. IBT 35674x]|nr:hypothetical protein N7451_005664 [Penicillium sp. IBT 35674x]
MMDFVYTGEYDDKFDENQTYEPHKTLVLLLSPLRLHAQLFALGDKYDIPGLCDAAADKYESKLWYVFFARLGHNNKLQNYAVNAGRLKFPYVLQDKDMHAKYEFLVEVPEFAIQFLDSAYRDQREIDAKWHLDTEGELEEWWAVKGQVNTGKRLVKSRST